MTRLRVMPERQKKWRNWWRRPTRRFEKTPEDGGEGLLTETRTGKSNRKVLVLRRYDPFQNILLPVAKLIHSITTFSPIIAFLHCGKGSSGLLF